MKKICFIMLALVYFCAAKSQEPVTKVVKFTRFIDDKLFAFRWNALNEFSCELKNLKIISLRDAPDCLKKSKEIKKFESAHKKEIEKIIKPGFNYYVTNYGQYRNGFICDVSDDKDNFRLLLVKNGYAIPYGDSEVLIKAHEEAKKAKRGMYSAKFWDVTNCILNGVPIPKKDEDK